MKNAIIEDPSIELLELFDRVSQEAKTEKNAVPPINKMIYWWTRKPLIVGRAMVLTSTLDNIKDVRSLLGLDSAKRSYQYVPDISIYKQKIGIDPKKIKVLDPFAGAGSLAFPTAELGLDLTLSDYNPLAYLIAKSILEFPVKYKKTIKVDFEKYIQLVIKKTEADCGKFFKEKQLAYLWCWCIQCPHCGQRVPLANQMYLSNTPKKKIGIKFITKNKDFSTELIRNISQEEGKKFTQKGGSAKCISCTNIIEREHMILDISKNKDREMIAIQIQTEKGRDYILPTSEDKEIHKEAVKYFELKKKEFIEEDLLPEETILPNRRREMGLWHYNIKHYSEYFDQRQLLVLISFLRNIKRVSDNIEDFNYRKVIALNLTAVLAKRVDMAGFGVHWHTTGEKPQNVLAFRQPTLVYNFAETNPFEKVSGSFNNIKKNISDGILFATRLQTNVECKLESVTTDSEVKYDLILTDPPYGDDVQYGELSEFFYVWIYRVLKDNFKELPPRAPLEEDFCESWGRFGQKKIATQFFEKGLKKSFVSMNKKLKDDGLLVVFFAHSSIEAWNLFLESIRAGKFKVVSSYSIHTENTKNVIARGKTSFMSSIVVVCRKILEPSEKYFEDIIPEIEDKIKNMMRQIPDEKLLALPITDLLIMVYGKVLEGCTQHTILKSYQKDFTPNFENLIGGARSFILKELVAKITGKSTNVIGPKMAFYILIKIFHNGMIAGDDANKMAKIYDVKMDDLEKERIVTKDKDVIRLYYLNENEMGYSPDNVDKNNLYQQLCYLAYTVDSRGSDKIPGIMSKDNFRLEDLKQIISLLIKNYHLRKNKGESLGKKDQKELEILETLADITGIKLEGNLDSYLEK